MDAIQLLKRARDHRQHRRYQDGLHDCDAALGLDPTLVEAYLLRAELRLHSNNPYLSVLRSPAEPVREAMMADIEAAVRLAPTNIAVLMEAAQQLGPICGIRGIDRAIKICTTVIALDRTHRRAYALRAWLYSFKQQHAEALMDYKKVIQLDPTNPDGYAARGRCYEDLRLRTLAAADFQQALALGYTGYHVQYLRDYVSRYGKDE